MEIITDLSHFDKSRHQKLVVAIGNFDGVHLGHKEIIELAKSRAKEIDGTAAIFTFREHPRRVLAKQNAPEILTSLEHKLVLLEQSGIELCFLINFTKQFSEQSAENFVKEILVGQLNAREICMGFNARFGHDRRGDNVLMQELAKKYNFTFIEAPACVKNGQAISSTLLRSLIKKGDLEETAQLLGRPYSFFGTVIRGHGRGKELGIPTANLDPHSEVLPPEGVYAVRVRIFECELLEMVSGITKLEKRTVGDHLLAVLNYGTCPTFGAEDRALPEVHVLDYHQDLIGKTVEVEVGLRIRDEQKFPNAEALKNQIFKDIETAKSWFKRA